MAQSLEQILGKTINSTKELKNEINALRDSLINVDSSSDEWQSTAEKLTAAQERLTSITQAGKTSMDAAEDSIVGLEKQYKALYNTYKLLSEEQRNSDFGKQMATSLEGLSSKLNDTKKDVGNFKDNIGRYTSSAMEAFNTLGISVGGLQKPMQLATVGANGLGAAFKSLIANPVGAIIMAIVVAFKAMQSVVDNVRDAINNNEESQQALSVAMSAFQPVLDKISNMWDKLGQQVVKVIGWFGDAFSKLREINAKVTDFLGITEGATEAVKEQNEQYRRLAITQNEITKEKREQKILNEEERAYVEQLKAEAQETTDAKVRLEKLTKAKEILQGVTDREIKLAEKELNYMKEKATLTANSADDNDKIAQKEAEVNAIRRNGNSQLKELNGQIRENTTRLNSNTKELDRNKTAVDEQANARKALLEEIEDYGKKESELLLEEYEEKKALIKDNEEALGKLRVEYQKRYNELVEQEQKDADNKKRQDRADKLDKFENEFLNRNSIQTDTEISKYYADADTDPRGTGEAEAFRRSEDYYRGWLEKKAELIETELGMEMDSVERKLELERELWATKEEMRNIDYENQLQLYELQEKNKEKDYEVIDSYTALNDAVGSLSSTIANLINNEIQEGKLSEKEIEKKKKNLKTLEKIQLAVGIASVVASTAGSIMDIWRGYSLERIANTQTALATGPAAAPVVTALNAKSLVSAILQTTGVAVAGASQLAALSGGYISNVKAINDIGGAGTATSVSPTTIDSSSYSYTRNLQTEAEEEALNNPIWVSVVDIEEGLNRVKVVERESVF